MDTGGEHSRIAFICAMPMELKPLARKLGLQKATVEGVEVRAGTMEDREVVAIVTGMGTELARTATARLLDAVDVDHVVVVGITGAIENETPIGTLVMPEVVVNSHTDAEYRPTPLGGHQHAGKMWTTDVLLTDADHLAGLRAQGVVSLDMETAAIAEVCEERGIPWSVFRVISDRASDGSVDEEVFAMSNQDGSPNPRAVAKYFLTHPHKVPAMLRLARGSKLATETAADHAIRAVTTGDA